MLPEEDIQKKMERKLKKAKKKAKYVTRNLENQPQKKKKITLYVL